MIGNQARQQLANSFQAPPPDSLLAGIDDCGGRVPGEPPGGASVIDDLPSGGKAPSDALHRGDERSGGAETRFMHPHLQFGYPEADAMVGRALK